MQIAQETTRGIPSVQESTRRIQSVQERQMEIDLEGYDSRKGLNHFCSGLVLVMVVSPEPSRLFSLHILDAIIKKNLSRKYCLCK